MKIGIAADHAGFGLKEKLTQLLMSAGYDVVDFGNRVHDENDDYPEFVFPLARGISSGHLERAIVISSDGIGACIAANKIRRVRATVCYDDSTVRTAVEQADINVLCLGARYTGLAMGWNLTATFLETTFSGIERHRRRLAAIAQLEDEILSA